MTGEFEVVGEASSGREGLERAQTDMVPLDLGRGEVGSLISSIIENGSLISDM